MLQTKKSRTHFLVLPSACLLIWGIAVGSSIAAETARRTACPKGVDLHGQLHHPGQRADTKAVVVCFLSTQCPVSNSYLPTLSRMASMYRRQGVEFYGVMSDPAVTREEALAHSEQFHIGFPVLFDASGALRQVFRPTHTPHVFVMNDEGNPLYDGAIDNWFVKLGQKRQRPTQHYLDDAINMTLDEKRIRVRSTTPIGCLLEEPQDKATSGSVTFTRDIAPIIQANCASCHRTGQAGPFPLLTYRDVSKHARQIVEVTQARFMPPWKPESNFGRFLDERRLTARQLSLLKVWTENGKPEGDPADLPQPLEFTEGWRLGEPDAILRMRHVFPIPASGPDIRQYFVIPAHLAKSRLITAIDFQPGAPQAIHHASFYLDTKRAARSLDAADPEPGYRGFGGPKIDTQGTLRSWFPGMSPRHLPKGMGRLVPRGADIVAEIHYVCSGKPERDRSQIGLYYASRSARQLVEEIQVANKQIKIPAGAKRHHETASFTVPVETVLLDVAPHMHELGREIKVIAKLPDGSVEPLVWIRDWDFNWQSQYSYARPIRLPANSRILVDAWYDNSAENPLNPNSPPKTVSWGEDSADEMLICHFQCTCDSLTELRQLIGHYKKYFDAAQQDPTRSASEVEKREPTNPRPFR